MRKLLCVCHIFIIGLFIFCLWACNKTPKGQDNQGKAKDVQQVEKKLITQTDKTDVAISLYLPSWKYEGKDLLCKAISANDLQGVKQLIKDGVNVNNPEACSINLEYMTQACNFSALSLAITEGNLNIVKELIKAGADVNKKTYCATWYGGEGEDEYYVAPLYIAMKGIPFDEKKSNKDIVKELVLAGADVNAIDEDNNTLLELADDVEIAQILLQYGAKDSLVAAINRKDWDAFNNLLKTSDLKAKNKALASAVTLNNISLTQKIIEAGANVNSLIKRDPYPNEGCPITTPLSAALDGKFSNMATLLKEKGAHETVCTAIASKDLQRVQQIVQVGTDFNKEYEYCIPFDCDNIFPLWQAVRTENVEIIKLLLDNGVNLNDIKGNTALKLAQETGNEEIVKLLKSAGAKE